MAFDMNEIKEALKKKQSRDIKDNEQMELVVKNVIQRYKEYFETEQFEDDVKELIKKEIYNSKIGCDAVCITLDVLVRPGDYVSVFQYKSQLTNLCTYISLNSSFAPIALAMEEKLKSFGFRKCFYIPKNMDLRYLNDSNSIRVPFRFQIPLDID